VIVLPPSQGRVPKDSAAACRALATRRGSGVGFVRFDNATTRGGRSPQCRIDDRHRASHAGFHPDGLGRAILGARAALHARVAVPDANFAIIPNEYLVRTYVHAGTAPLTFFGIERERHHVLQVCERSHHDLLYWPRRGAELRMLFPKQGAR
jgi:hypothetical protein